MLLTKESERNRLLWSVQQCNRSYICAIWRSWVTRGNVDHVSFRFGCVKARGAVHAAAASCLVMICISSGLGRDNNQDSNPANQPSDPTLYVGTDTCETCHQAEAESYGRGPHWRTETGKQKGPQWQGCEACHGPGKAHADTQDPTKIIRVTSLSAKQASERCLVCHEKNETHQNFMRSPHLTNGVGCTTCHSIHASKASPLLVSAQPGLCYGCHQSVTPDFSKPEHHRVNEGLMLCTDCHNPHGSFLPHQLQSSSWQALVCTKCHVDTAGPFVFEHAPVKEQGCMACHNPHGSTNPHLLTRPQVNQLCLECHSTILANSIAPGAPTFHNQAAQYSQCVLCHVAIHGSNTDPTFFKR
jgi:DmsE family decaheme c-type cytochrome